MTIKVINEFFYNLLPQLINMSQHLWEILFLSTKYSIWRRVNDTTCITIWLLLLDSYMWILFEFFIVNQGDNENQHQTRFRRKDSPYMETMDSKLMRLNFLVFSFNYSLIFYTSPKSLFLWCYCCLLRPIVSNKFPGSKITMSIWIIYTESNGTPPDWTRFCPTKEI